MKKGEKFRLANFRYLDYNEIEFAKSRALRVCVPYVPSCISKCVKLSMHLKCVKLSIKFASLMEFDEQFDAFAQVFTSFL